MRHNREEWADFWFHFRGLLFDLSPIALVALGCFFVAAVGRAI